MMEISQFFSNFFYFRRKIEFWPQTKEKNLTDIVFHSKAKNHISFFTSTARFGVLPDFVKTGNTGRAKWGEKNRFVKKASWPKIAKNALT